MPFRSGISGSSVSAEKRRGFGFSLMAGPASTPEIFTGTLVRKRQFPPTEELIFAHASCPSFHAISTVKPPRAFNPETLPSAQPEGRAGNRWMAPVWLCTSISATPAVYPKLPSIWNGGWASSIHPVGSFVLLKRPTYRSDCELSAIKWSTFTDYRYLDSRIDSFCPFPRKYDLIFARGQKRNFTINFNRRDQFSPPAVQVAP